MTAAVSRTARTRWGQTFLSAAHNLSSACAGTIDTAQRAILAAVGGSGCAAPRKESVRVARKGPCRTNCSDCLSARGGKRSCPRRECERTIIFSTGARARHGELTGQQSAAQRRGRRKEMCRRSTWSAPAATAAAGLAKGCAAASSPFGSNLGSRGQMPRPRPGCWAGALREV